MYYPFIKLYHLYSSLLNIPFLNYDINSKVKHLHKINDPIYSLDMDLYKPNYIILYIQELNDFYFNFLVLS